MTNLVMNNVRILDVEAGKLTPLTSVLVVAGQIKAIGSNITLPKKCQKIDGQGQCLMPGMIDCHVHICADGMINYPAEYETMTALKAGNELKSMLLRGFTTIRDAGGADAGFRVAVENGIVEGPRIYVSGQPISQTGGHGDNRHPAEKADLCGCAVKSGFGRIADGVSAVRHAVRDELRRGADQIKIMGSGGISSKADPIDYEQYSMEELEAAVDEATRRGTYVLAHAYTAGAIKRLVTAGVKSIEHGNLLDQETAKLMAEKGAFLVPTLVVYYKIIEQAEQLGVSGDHLEKTKIVMAQGLDSLKFAMAAGVEIAFGTDLFRPSNKYQTEELIIRTQVQTPAQVIKSATLVSAKLLGEAGKLGIIAEGAHADLLLVDGNPLEDISCLHNDGEKLSLIMKAGKIVKNTL